MSSNNWEKVGKTKTRTQAQKRSAADKMPKQDIQVAPLKVGKGMFHAVAEKPKQGASNNRKPLQDQSNSQSSPRGTNKQKQKKPKPAASSSKYSYSSFPEAVQDVSVINVYENADELRKTVKMWQKPVAAFINNAISCPSEGPAFLDKDFGYPLSQIPKTISAMLYQLFIEETPDVIKQLLFDNCVAAMLDCMTKDQPAWGYRLCIQVLAHNAPEVCIEDIQKDLSKISNMKNTPKRCLAYMWALGQVGYKNPKCGMNVWINLMLPMMGEKKLAGYVVHYLECLLASTKDPVGSLSGTIDAESFLQIMKWSRDSSTGLATDLRKRLLENLMTVQQIATANKALKLFLFEKFLTISPNEIMQYEQNFMDIIFRCLQGNTTCFEKWREAYTTSLPQTRFLLEHIEENWDCSVRLPKKEFAEIICAFNEINNDAATSSSPMTSRADFKTVNALCRHISQKLIEESSRTVSNRYRVFISLLFGIIAVMVAALFAYNVNGGKIEDTVAYKALESIGLMKYIKMIWENLSTVVAVAMRWLQDNLPYYWSRVNQVLGPYFAYLATLVSNVIHWVLEVSAPLRAMTAEYAEATLILIEQLLQKLLILCQDVFVSIRPSLLIFRSWLDAKMLSVIAFLNGEIGLCCVQDALKENAMFLYSYIYDAALFMWAHLLNLLKIASDYVSGENME